MCCCKLWRTAGAKIHLGANAHGLPLGLLLTPGQAHDVTAYDDLMAERDSDPGLLVRIRRMTVPPSAGMRAIAAPRRKSPPNALIA